MYTALPLPITFLDRDVESGATTRVLHELLSREDSQHDHLKFLLFDIPAGGKSTCYFDCSGVKFSVLCKKSMGERLLKRLFSLGMLITPEDVVKAVELLPDTESDTLDVIVARCGGPPEESLALAYVEAEKLNKLQLLDTLVKRKAVPPVKPQVYTYSIVYVHFMATPFVLYLEKGNKAKSRGKRVLREFQVY